MTDPITAGSESSAEAPARRAFGHSASEVRATIAELNERAHLISEEAGSRMASAMKDLITAAAGLAGFAVESARDLVQFMVRRGQMTQDEADKLMTEVERTRPKKAPAPPMVASATARSTESVAKSKAPGGAGKSLGVKSLGGRGVGGKGVQGKTVLEKGVLEKGVQGKAVAAKGGKAPAPGRVAAKKAGGAATAAKAPVAKSAGGKTPSSKTASVSKNAVKPAAVKNPASKAKKAPVRKK